MNPFGRAGSLAMMVLLAGCGTSTAGPPPGPPPVVIDPTTGPQISSCQELRIPPCANFNVPSTDVVITTGKGSRSTGHVTLSWEAGTVNTPVTLRVTKGGGNVAAVSIVPVGGGSVVFNKPLKLRMRYGACGWAATNRAYRLYRIVNGTPSDGAGNDHKGANPPFVELLLYSIQSEYVIGIPD